MRHRKSLLVNIFAAASLLLTVLSFQLSPALAAAPACGANQTYISIPISGSNHCVDNGNGTVESNPVFVWALAILKFLAAGVGIGVTAGIVYGGILYGSSQGNPAQIKKAISVIVSAVTGLVLFIMMSAIVNFIIPGGIFK